MRPEPERKRRSFNMNRIYVFVDLIELDMESDFGRDQSGILIEESFMLR